MISYKKFQSYAGSIYHDGFDVSNNHDLLAENICRYVWSPCVWKDGKRKRCNFLFSDFMVLDFDEPGESTLLQINNILEDHKRIIATTKSHQVEKGGVTCDRFRLVVPWSERITSLEKFEYNMQRAHARFDWADRCALDGARFFFPCKEIVVCDRNAEYKWDTLDKQDAPKKTIIKEDANGKIPFWCLAFINDGIFKTSRNLTLLGVAIELFELGFSEQKILEMISRSPIDWHGVNKKAVVASARGKANGGSKKT